MISSEHSSSERAERSTERPLPVHPRYEYLEAYAEQDAILGSPNPRYKRSSIYCNKYLDVRVQLVGTEGLTDTEWDLTLF